MSVFQAFRSLPVVKDTCSVNALPERARSFTKDTLTLGWEDRLKTRARRMSDGGVEFGTALARGMTLRQGDCLVIDELRLVVSIVERDEPVFLITPRSAQEWGLFAYHIGNNHLPVMIDSGALVCPDVPGMEQVLELHGIPYSRALRPFTPLAALPDHLHA